MQTFRVLAILLVIGTLILGYAIWGSAGRAKPEARPEDPPPIPVAQFSMTEPIKQIEMEYHQPDLSPGPGHDQFAAQCVICHSPRYVIDQPTFPRKTWTAEVQKMVKSYGAMIPMDQQKEIVNYLVYWHGKEDAPAAAAQKTK